MSRKKSARIVSEIDPKYSAQNWWLKLLRVVAYIRVSTDSHDQENSLKNQRQHYEKLISQHPNWEFMGVYADEGISGTSVRNRKGFRDMIEACKRGEVDLIVVKEVSRFARNTGDCLNTVEELLTLDPPVGIYFENNNLNTLDMGNKAFLTMFAMFAELDSELKSKSVDFGLQAIYDRGNYLCPAMNLLGYEKDGKYMIKVEPQGAKTVRLIYDLFLAGYSQKEIAAILTELGLPTAKGNLIWSPAAVSGICRNEKYCGALFMQKSYTVSFLTHQSRRNIGQKRLFFEPEHHEPIVTSEDHARVLLLLKANHESEYFNHKYVLRVIKRGLLSGFIPLNVAFGGYDASNYLAALIMARLPAMSIDAEVAHIAGTKRVRRELFSDKDTAAVTISRHGFLFNCRCVSILQDANHVEILLHPGERLLAIRSCRRKNRNAITWINKMVPAKKLTPALFDLMGWQRTWKYKCAANCFSNDQGKVLLFDLSCCEYRLPDNEGNGKLTRAVPREWISSFGHDMPEQMMLCRRALADTLKDWHIHETASFVDGFSIGTPLLSRADAEKRIAETKVRTDG